MITQTRNIEKLANLTYRDVAEFYNSLLSEQDTMLQVFTQVAVTNVTICEDKENGNMMYVEIVFRAFRNNVCQNDFYYRCYRHKNWASFSKYIDYLKEYSEV